KEAAGFQGREWGPPIDPDRACQFTFGEGSVTIEVPAGARALLHPMFKDQLKAPRILRSVTGDFEARVRVRGDFQLSPPHPRGGVEATAGLLVVDNDTPRWPTGRRSGTTRAGSGSVSR